MDSSCITSLAGQALISRLPRYLDHYSNPEQNVPSRFDVLVAELITSQLRMPQIHFKSHENERCLNQFCISICYLSSVCICIQIIFVINHQVVLDALDRLQIASKRPLGAPKTILKLPVQATKVNLFML